MVDAADFVPFEDLEPEQEPAPRDLSWLSWSIWIGAICLGIAVVGLVRVTTHLGVLAANPFATGREYIWRVWLRASYNWPLSGDSWFGGAVVGFFGILFLAALAGALQVALQDDPSNG